MSKKATQIERMIRGRQTVRLAMLDSDSPKEAWENLRAEGFKVPLREIRNRWTRVRREEGIYHELDFG